jgi:transposase
MPRDVEVRLGPEDRERLEAVVADRNRAQKHVWRAQIVLATAAGCGTAQIMRRAGVSKPCVRRWQRRFMEAGVDALLHDKTRKPGKAPVAEPSVAQLVERTLGAPPGETTHWTSRAMVDVMGLAISTVQKIWRAHGLAPHRLRTFKLSRDPQLPPRCTTWSDFTSTRRRIAWCSRSTRRARSRACPWPEQGRSIAPSRVCR